MLRLKQNEETNEENKQDWEYTKQINEDWTLK
jgi:hypothetical protein